MSSNIEGKVVVITGASSGVRRGDWPASFCVGRTCRAGCAPRRSHQGIAKPFLALVQGVEKNCLVT